MRNLRSRGNASLVFICFVEYSNFDRHKTSLRIIEQAVSVSMGQDLELVSISEARARACVSIYFRMFVNLPFRTLMAKTQLSSNVLFVALIFPVAKPTTRTRSPCAMNSGGSGYEVSTVSLAF